MTKRDAIADSPYGMERVLAIVLGGGRGTRLFPLTAERAKPAVPLCGRYRLVDIPLSNCIHSGVNRIFVLTQFNSVSLHRHINLSYKFDVFSNGFVDVLAAQQTVETGDWYQGTADAVRKHLRHFRTLGPAHYLILSGDQLYRMDYRHLMRTHLETKADITVAAIPVAKENAHTFGILKTDDAARVTHFVEKPRAEDALTDLVSPSIADGQGRDYLASMGIYMFRAEELESLLESQPDWVDFGTDVIPKSLETRKVCAHQFSGFWEDIGTMRSYYETSLAMAKPNPPFRFHDPNHIIYSHPRYLPGARLRDARVDDSVICEGSHIAGSTIDNSVIGIRTITRAGVTIKRSIIMGADYYEDAPDEGVIPLGVGEGSHVENAVVDKNARIGRNVRLCGSVGLGDPGIKGVVVRDGIIVVVKGTAIPDGTVVE
jgi:glucose-1-phosphate adenylyltransferase